MKRKTYFITKYQYGKSVVDLNEHVLSLATDCNLNCEYCYLRFSKTTSQPVIYNNLDKLQYELELLFSNIEQKIFYFNFGETSDSLLTKKHFEVIYNSTDIISQVAKKYNKVCFIELRTKTNNIYNFVNNRSLIYDNVKLVYTVSLSPQVTVEQFEPLTLNTEGRIQTLSFAENAGFLTGVRFEPIIIYPVKGITYNDIVNSVKLTIENYKQLIMNIFERINLKSLHSITLSCLRLTKKQFKKLKQQKSKLCFPEMFLCQDGKYRYSRPVRITIYKELINFIKNLHPYIEQKLLLSFEFEYIWKNCDLQIKTLPQISKFCI